MVKIYAHRGFRDTNNIKSNSVASVISSFENGFRAIEIDIWYYKKQLLVNHNQPRKENCHELPQLEEIFLYKNQISYWLDFKNLNGKNTLPVMMEIKKIFSAKKIDLTQIYFAPFITDEKKLLPVIAKIREVFGKQAQIMAVCEKLEKKKQQNFYQFLQEQEIKFLSIKHDLIDTDFIKIFQGIIPFAWTVNDLEIMKKLIKLGVKNFTSDSITPKILENAN